MAVVITRHEWRTQPPPGNSRISRSNPLTSGLRALFLPHWPIELVNRVAFNNNTVPAITANRAGVGRIGGPNGATFAGWTTPEFTQGTRSEALYHPQAPPITLFYVAVTSTTAAFVIGRCNASSNAAFMLGIHQGATPRGARMRVTTSGGTIAHTPSAALMDASAPVAAVLSIGTANTLLYAAPLGSKRLVQTISNATPSGDFTYDWSTATASRSFSVIGGFEGTAATMMLAGMVVGYAWDDQQAIEFISNPWQLFEPITARYWVSTADLSVTLTGVSAGGSVSDLTATITGASLSETLTGVSATASVSNITGSTSTAGSETLTSVTATASVGTLEPSSTTILDVTLTGVSAAASVSDLTPLIAAAGELTGVSATASVFDLSVETTTAYEVTLTSVSATGEVFDLAPSSEISLVVTLTGVSATGSVRDLRIPDAEPLIDEEIRALLAPLVQGHVHPLRRPQRKDQLEANAHLPEIVYTIVSDDWEQAETLCGVGLHATRVQVDVYAQHYREARAYAYAVAKQLDTIGWRINMQPFPDDDEKIYRWQLEYSCWRNEAPPNLPLIGTHRG